MNPDRNLLGKNSNKTLKPECENGCNKIWRTRKMNESQKAS